MNGQAYPQLALLTCHGKGEVIGPLLAEHCGTGLVVTDAFDTDRLGTFSGETPRTLPALDCATRKAELACELTGLSVGLGSEGSVGEVPAGGLLPWHQELVVLVDSERDLRIIGRHEGPAFQRQQRCTDWPTLAAFFNDTGPEQAVLLRNKEQLRKGLTTLDSLKAAFEELGGEVDAELDLRAHLSVRRRQRIAAATHNLIERLQSLCPACESPGFWVERGEPGLPCAACGQATWRMRARIWHCPACQYQVRRPVKEVLAEPRHCQACNP